jgi:hypothetical protein
MKTLITFTAVLVALLTKPSPLPAFEPASAGPPTVRHLPDDAAWIIQRYSREQTMALWKASLLHYQNMQELEWQFPAQPHLYQAWLKDAKWCADVWYIVDDIVMYNKSNSEIVAEKCRILRTMIGDKAYFLGELPPIWPVWWFRVMD